HRSATQGPSRHYGDRHDDRTAGPVRAMPRADGGARDRRRDEGRLTLMKIGGETHVRDVVAALPGAAAVFDAFGIDYSSSGERTIAEAAGLEGIGSDAVVLHLRRLPPEEGPSWLDRSVSELVAALTGEHDRLTRDEMVRAAEQLAGICTEPGAVDSLLQRMREEFKTFSTELLAHIHREQEEVFPLVRRLEALWQSNSALTPRENGLQTIIKELVVDHGSIAAHLRAVRELRMEIESHDVSTSVRGLLQTISKLEARVRMA